MKRDALMEKLCEGCPLPGIRGFGQGVSPSDEPDPLDCLCFMAPLRYREGCLEQGAKYVADYQTPEGTVIRLLEMLKRRESCEPCLLSAWCDWNSGPQRQYVAQVFKPREYRYGVESWQHCRAQCQPWFLPCVTDRESALRKLEKMAEEFGWRRMPDGEAQDPPRTAERDS